MDMSVPPIKATKLNEKAMLVKLTTRKPRLSRRDAVAEELIQNTLDDASLVVNSKLFRDKLNPINRLVSAASEIYTWHKANTLPWCDKGPRVLPNANFFEYNKMMRDKITNIDTLLNAHMPTYHDHVAADIAFRSKSLTVSARATADDYPSADAFRARLGFDLRFMPLPDESHFLFDVGQDELAGFSEAMQDATKAARVDVIKRMLTPLQHLVSKLSLNIGEPGSIFRDSALENCVEGCELARKLNIDDNPEIEALTASIAKVVSKLVDGKDHLRESQATRDSAVKKLKELEAKMSAFMNGV